MKTILVLGGAGFIGRHMVKTLEELGHVVVSVDKTRVGSDIVCDLTDSESTLQVFKNTQPDEVYHLASDVGGVNYMYSPNGSDVLCNDTAIAISVVNAIKKCGLKRLLYVSSSTVYPTRTDKYIPTNKLLETSAWPANPPNTYGLAKLLSEEILTRSLADTQCGITVVRLNNTYGPGMCCSGNKTSVVASLIVKILANPDTLEVMGSGDEVRTFLYVSDAVSAICAAMETYCDGTINIGYPDPVTIAHLACLIQMAMGTRIPLVFTNISKGPQWLVPNTDKARCQLGWEPTVYLADGLVSTYQNIKRRCTVCS